MTLTLKALHKELGLEQALKIYVRNTNKKYSASFTEDEELSVEVYMLIKFNTLGKLRRHSQQMNFITSYTENLRDNKLLRSKAEELSGRVKTAQDLIKKDNLKDAYIETLKMSNHYHGGFGISEEVIDFLGKNGIKYAQHLSSKGVEQFFEERLAWFEAELSK